METFEVAKVSVNFFYFITKKQQPLYTQRPLFFCLILITKPLLPGFFAVAIQYFAADCIITAPAL